MNVQILPDTKRHRFSGRLVSRKMFRIPGKKCAALSLPMEQLSILSLVLHLSLFFCVVAAQYSPSSQDDLPFSKEEVNNFKPSLLVVIGILIIMFSITFVLILFAKFCHRSDSPVSQNQQNTNGVLLARSAAGSRFSGIDKTVIESLPFFRFSSLKGSREGLECVVCLSKFEEIEILRLLPNCRHAFHIDCVDQWLEKHSSCPLCRHKVSADDLELLKYSNSLRFLWSQQSEVDDEDSNVELFVQREENPQGSSSFSVGSSFRRVDKGEKEEDDDQEVSIQDGKNQKFVLKFNSKIVVSDVVLKNRWSNVSSSDLLMFLNRFSSIDLNNIEKDGDGGGVAINIKEEIERKRVGIGRSDSFPSRLLNPTEKRSISDITVQPRFVEMGLKTGNDQDHCLPENAVKEERMKRVWLPIVRRTCQWFAKRETLIRSQQSEKTIQSLNA